MPTNTGPDVLIIGGGVIGLSCAYRLAKDGLAVTVLERGQCGQEASWAGVGILEPCSWHREDELARINQDALERYPEFVAELRERSGVDPQYQRCGRLQIIRDDNRMKMAASEVAAVGDQRMPDGGPIVSTLTPAEAAALEPNLTVEMTAAQYCRMTAQIRNPRLLKALVGACRNAGVVIEEGLTVRSLLKDGDTVLGVVTDQGERRAGHTILCAGAWSAELDPALALHTPVYPVRGQIILLQVEKKPFERIIKENNFYMCARDDGHVLIGATEEHDSGFSKRNTPAGLGWLSQQAVEFVRCLGNAPIERTWAGLRPGTPDRRPFMGFVPGLKNLIAATGHFRSGLTAAPIVADIVADLLQHGRCDYDLKKAAPGRKFVTPLTADNS